MDGRGLVSLGALALAACFSVTPQSPSPARGTPTAAPTPPPPDEPASPPPPAQPVVVTQEAVVQHDDGTRTVTASDPVTVRLGFDPRAGWIRVVRGAPCDGELAAQIIARGSDTPAPWRSFGAGAPLDGNRCGYWIPLTDLLWLDKQATFTIAGARFAGGALTALAGELDPLLATHVKVETKTKARTVTFSVQPVQPYAPTPLRGLYPTVSIHVTEPAGGTPRAALTLKAGTISAEAETIGGGGSATSMTWDFALAQTDAVRLAKAAKLELRLDSDPPTVLSPNPLRALIAKLDKVYAKVPPPPAQPPATSRFDAP